MVKIEDLQVLASNFGIDVMADFLNANFFKVCYEVESAGYFIKRILLTSLYEEKNDFKLAVSGQIGERSSSDYAFLVGKMLQKHFPTDKRPDFLSDNSEAVSRLRDNENVISFVPRFKDVKSPWWVKLCMNVEEGGRIFAKIKEQNINFYGLTNQKIKEDGDITVLVAELTGAVPEEMLRMGLISVDIKVKEVVDYMPTNSGKILYLLEVDGKYEDRHPALSLSFDFDGTLFQILKKVGSYNLEYEEE
ncbi:MAG: hypothetical protein LBR35_01600 [Rickettsiales bacterium]|nr:hypothetical protein [Rickettsiales bacterium]